MNTPLMNHELSKHKGKNPSLSEESLEVTVEVDVEKEPKEKSSVLSQSTFSKTDLEETTGEKTAKTKRRSGNIEPENLSADTGYQKTILDRLVDGIARILKSIERMLTREKPEPEAMTGTRTSAKTRAEEEKEEV